MREKPSESVPGKPRQAKTYRAARRNNAIAWRGVKVDRKSEHSPLTVKTSDKGEKHYVELW